MPTHRIDRATDPKVGTIEVNEKKLPIRLAGGETFYVESVDLGGTVMASSMAELRKKVGTRVRAASGIRSKNLAVVLVEAPNYSGEPKYIAGVTLRGINAHTGRIITLGADGKSADGPEVDDDVFLYRPDDPSLPELHAAVKRLRDAMDAEDKAQSALRRLAERTGCQLHRLAYGDNRVDSASRLEAEIVEYLEKTP